MAFAQLLMITLAAAVAMAAGELKDLNGLRNLRFHPDGKQIAFTAGSYSAEVWVMENFLPKAEATTARLEE